MGNTDMYTNDGSFQTQGPKRWTNLYIQMGEGCKYTGTPITTTE